MDQVPHIPPDSEYANRMKTIHHEELLANPVQFDMIVIFSSIEHDGLGRYHDPISPGGPNAILTRFDHFNAI